MLWYSCPDLPDLLRNNLDFNLQQNVFSDWNLLLQTSDLATVAEEMLGVNVSYTTGGGTLASMQAITGCTNAGDPEDPGCGAEVPCKRGFGMLHRLDRPRCSRLMLPGQQYFRLCCFKSWPAMPWHQ